MSLDLGQLQRISNFLGFNGPPKEPHSVKMGVMGASQVATYALIWPARRVAKAEVVAVAARDGTRAREYAHQQGVRRSYGSYSELLADPEVRAVYVGLPNGLHGQWARKALEAGKHVLCEKPFAANEQEAREVHAEAARRGLLCREAFHYREHPFMTHLREVVGSGALGRLTRVDAQVLIPWWVFGGANIRFQETLAGGAMMDAGCYCMHALRTLLGGQPVVESATAQMVANSKVVDGAMSGTLRWQNQPQMQGTFTASLQYSGLFPKSTLELTGDRGRLLARNFIMPVFGNSATFTPLDAQGRAAGPSTTTRVYGAGESTYFHQLQRFAEDVQALEEQRERDAEGEQRSKARKVDGQQQQQRGRALLDSCVHPLLLEDERDSCANMAAIDATYRAAGLQPRNASSAQAAQAAAMPTASKELPIPSHGQPTADV